MALPANLTGCMRSSPARTRGDRDRLKRSHAILIFPKSVSTRAQGSEPPSARPSARQAHRDRDSRLGGS